MTILATTCISEGINTPQTGIHIVGVMKHYWIKSKINELFKHQSCHLTLGPVRI